MNLLRLKLYLSYLKSKPEKSNINKNRKKIIIALAANYGNLGDVAITYAQKEFLKKYFPKYDIIEFKITDTFSKMKSLKSIVNNDDIITVVGGGNFGDLYDDIEFCRQFIVSSFPSNKIVIFPQTIYFSDSSKGRKKLSQSRHIYNRHKDLTIFVREKYSFEKYERYFPNKMILVPDIVLSQFFPDNGNERSGITVCFRSDKEDLLGKEYKYSIIRLLQNIEKVNSRDTHVGKANNLDDLYKELFILVDDFRHSSVVVTDRLHGMILCYITQTPCVAIAGGNKKIVGCYEWISKSNYIELIDDALDEKDILFKVNNLLKLEEKNSVSLDSYFKPIIDIIKKHN